MSPKLLRHTTRFTIHTNQPSMGLPSMDWFFGIPWSWIVQQVLSGWRGGSAFTHCPETSAMDPSWINQTSIICGFSVIFFIISASGPSPAAAMAVFIISGFFKTSWKGRECCVSFGCQNVYPIQNEIHRCQKASRCSRGLGWSCFMEILGYLHPRSLT